MHPRQSNAARVKRDSERTRDAFEAHPDQWLSRGQREIARQRDADDAEYEARAELADDWIDPDE